MTNEDKTIANSIRLIINDLNTELSNAAKAGIEVNIDQIDGTTMDSPVHQIILTSRCRRILEI